MFRGKAADTAGMGPFASEEMRMLDVGTVVFLAQFTPTNQRVLYPGRVLEADEHSFMAQFADPLTPTFNADVLLYAIVEQKFLRQPAAVVAIKQTEMHPLIAFRPTADAVSVEKRVHGRVSVAALGMYARINREARCPVMDLSPEGFAAVTGAVFNLGDTVDVAMTYPGLTCSGQARVQTCTDLGDGRYRYGFLSTEPRSSMRKMLSHLTVSIRRLQMESWQQIA